MGRGGNTIEDWYLNSCEDSHAVFLVRDQLKKRLGRLRSTSRGALSLQNELEANATPVFSSNHSVN